MQENRTVFIASDHAGFELKSRLQQRFPEIKWQDLGPASADRVDYPDFADRVVENVVLQGAMGVLICGSGQGMAMRANRHPKIRAALCWSEESAQLSRQHNDANVLCLGARLLSEDMCAKILDAFLKTPFEGGRHAGRIGKLGLPPKPC